ncbi:hypothetical protein BaRGS_00003791 [Batillaria attramentaria]|uniref:Uncharacterized protein n=1 Tax=Batillaria attramentaria TaxID=370345 RepID=A0ABD0M068_9CAEN
MQQKPPACTPRLNTISCAEKALTVYLSFPMTLDAAALHFPRDFGDPPPPLACYYYQWWILVNFSSGSCRIRDRYPLLS